MSQDINTWLRALGLGQYCDVFAAGDVDLRVLPHLTETDLRELGVSLGHRKIAIIRGPKTLGDSSPRWRGVRKCAEACGLELDSRLIVEIGRAHV